MSMNNKTIGINRYQFAYNTATRSTTKATPFELMYGRSPTVPLDLMFSHEKVELYLTPAGY